MRYKNVFHYNANPRRGRKSEPDQQDWLDFQDQATLQQSRVVGHWRTDQNSYLPRGRDTKGHWVVYFLSDLGEGVSLSQRPAAPRSVAGMTDGDFLSRLAGPGASGGIDRPTAGESVVLSLRQGKRHAEFARHDAQGGGRGFWTWWCSITGKIRRDLFHGIGARGPGGCYGLTEFSELFVRGFLRARSYSRRRLKHMPLAWTRSSPRSWRAVFSREGSAGVVAGRGGTGWSKGLATTVFCTPLIGA